MDRLRDREPETESFRFADVSVYVDHDGSRYRIERLPAPSQSTTEQPTPLRASPDLASSSERRRTAYRNRNVEDSNRTSPLAPSQLPLHRPRNDQQLLQSETVRKRSADGREDSDISSRSFGEAPLPNPRDIRHRQRGEQGDGRYTDETYSTLENSRYPPWKDLESEGPSLELSPVHLEAPPSFSRDHRLAHTATSASSPFSIIGNSQSHVSIPHSVSNGFDLRTPIVLPKSTPSTTSEDSLPIETETPGDRMLLETNAALATSLQAEFVSSSMRVFFNPTTDNLRFYLESDSIGHRKAQSFRVQRSNTELVPFYRYSPSHIRIICIKEKLPYRKKLTRAPMESPNSREDAGISIFCEFYTMEALFEFQKKLLDEEVFLDIERARYLKLYEDGSSTRQIDAPRIQIWRENRSDKAVFDDNMSHYTAGTMLSGPMKDRVAPAVSRLVMYLGRSEEYMTIFITDDVTIQEKGQARIVFSATRFGLLKPRTGIRCYHATRIHTPAGIKLDKAGIQPEEQNRFGTYKSFEVEFESAQNRLSFVETWNRVLQARRRERIQLKAIEEEVSNDVYTGKTARKIVM